MYEESKVCEKCAGFLAQYIYQDLALCVHCFYSVVIRQCQWRVQMLSEELLATQSKALAMGAAYERALVEQRLKAVNPKPKKISVKKAVEMTLPELEPKTRKYFTKLFQKYGSTNPGRKNQKLSRRNSTTKGVSPEMGADPKRT